MTHSGKEFALCAIRPFGLFARGLDRMLDDLALSDVSDRRHHEQFVVYFDRPEADLNRNFGLILAPRE